MMIGYIVTVNIVMELIVEIAISAIHNFGIGVQQETMR